MGKTGLIVSDAKLRRDAMKSRLATMLAQGMSIRAAATAMDMPHTTLGTWATQPDVISLREALESDARSRARSIIADKSPDAAIKLADLTQCENPMIAWKASSDLLRLAGKHAEEGLMTISQANGALGQILAMVERVFADEPDKLREFYTGLQEMRSSGCGFIAEADTADDGDETEDDETSNQE